MELHEGEVIVPTRHGQMPAFAFHPTGGGPYPAILFFMDAPGMREELKLMARRIARAGYYCLLPDLYYRLGHLRFDIARRDDSMSKVITTCVSSLDNSKMMDDTAAMLAFVDGAAAARPGPVGCLGYCLGGKYVVVAAGTYPHRIASAAALYGIGLVSDRPDSPHLLADRIAGELYFGFAETDRSAPPELVAALCRTLDDANVRYLSEVHSGTSHGFCFTSRDNYVGQAAERTWDRMFALWKRTLSPIASTRREA